MGGPAAAAGAKVAQGLGKKALTQLGLSKLGGGRRGNDDDDGKGQKAKNGCFGCAAGCLALPIAVGVSVVLIFALLILLVVGTFVSVADACNISTSNTSSGGASGNSSGAMLAAKAAVAAGFRGDLLVTMVAVAGAESGWRTGAVFNGSCCYGLWQINANHGYSVADMSDPYKNAQEAMSIYRGQGLNMASWQTYGQGTYQTYMSTAQSVVGQLQSGGQIPANAPCTLSTISSGPVGACGNGGGGGGSSGGSPPSNTAGCGPASVDAAGYANPFRNTKGLVPQRIDMGVDYDGSGEIDTLGNAQITFAGTGVGGGWTCATKTNGAVVYKLLDGAYAGRYVYVAEDIIPSVSAGPTVIPAGQKIGDFPPGGCIEIGWSTSGSGADPEAAALGQSAPPPADPGSNRTFCGQMMSDLIKATPGGVAGTMNQPPSGSSCPPMTH